MPTPRQKNITQYMNMNSIKDFNVYEISAIESNLYKFAKKEREGKIKDRYFELLKVLNDMFGGKFEQQDIKTYMKCRYYHNIEKKSG